MTANGKKIFVSGWRLWNRFWFESNGPEKLRLFRIVFASLMFGFYAIRSLDLNLYFSDDGILPLAMVSEIMPLRYHYSLLFWFPGNTALWVANCVFLISILTLALGVFPRLSALVAFVLHVSILHRNMAPTFGADFIATFFFLYLIFARYEKDDRSPVSSAALRLLQIQVCIIYAYAGLDKVRGTPWWSGEAIWSVLANAQLARFDFSFMAHFPLLIVFLTYSTLAFEIYFPVLVWLKQARIPLLLFGVALHVGIALAMNIPFFGMLMMVAYLVFLEEHEAGKALGWLKLSKRRA